VSSRRLVLFGPLAPPYGGVAIHVSQLQELLRDRGVDSHVVAPGWSGHATETLHPFEMSPWRRPMSFLGLARIAGRGGVLHNHMSWTVYPSRRALGVLLQTCRVAGLRRLETLHDGRFIDRWSGMSQSHQHLFLEAMRTAVRVITIGDPLRAFLTSLGVPEDRVVSSGPLLSAAIPTAPLDDRFNVFLNAHPSAWLTIGAMIPLYDFETVARAFAEHRATTPNAGLVVLSAGFVHDAAYEARVRTAISRSGDDVLFATDVAPDQVAAIIRRASVVIRGPSAESFGLTRAEAAIAGVPVVATATGSTRYMELYTHGQPASVAAAVDRALRRTPVELEEAARYYRTLADRNLETILGVYEEVGIHPT